MPEKRFFIEGDGPFQVRDRSQHERVRATCLLQADAELIASLLDNHSATAGDAEHKERVLGSCKSEIILFDDGDYVFAPAAGMGCLKARDLRIIADELDRRSMVIQDADLDPNKCQCFTTDVQPINRCDECPR